MIKIWRILLPLFSFLLSHSLWAAEVLDVFTFLYPPYMIEDSPGKLSGFHIDVFEECLKPSGLKPRYHVYPIRRSTMEFLKLDNRKSFVHLGTAVNFKSEIAAGEVEAITLSVGKFKAFAKVGGKILLQNIADLALLRSYRVAALRGSAIVPILKKHGIIPLEVSDIRQLFKVLNAGRVDASVVLELSGDYHLQKNPELQLKKLPAVLAEAPLSFLISKQHPQYKKIVSLINERLKVLKETGQMQAIAKRYGESF